MPNFTLNDAVFENAAKQYPTPFYLYDEKGILDNIARVKQAFAWAPGYMEYFAVKALPNPQILKLFVENGFGLDCASECELMLAEKAGARGKVMFSANDVPKGEFAMAQKMGAILNLDDITDIEQMAEECGVPEMISIRFNPGGDFSGQNAIIGQPAESKYGWTKVQMVEGLKKLRQMGLKRFGIHALLSSNSLEQGYYPALAELLMRTAADCSAESGVELAFVNLSGGVGIPYRPEQKKLDIMEIGAQVRKAYEAVFGDPSAAKVRICSEMGRFMTGPYGWLVTKAIHEKQIYRHYIGVDACSANLPRPAIYGAYHHVSVVGKREMPETEIYDVVGSLCENSDKFAVQRSMPKVDKGDLLLIHDAGAHCWAMGHNYNGRLSCAEILFEKDGGYRMIRRAQKPEDYFATLID